MELPKFTAPEVGVINWEVKDWSSFIALIDADFLKYFITSSIYKRIMDEGEQHSQEMVDFEIEKYLSREIFNKFKAKSYVFCFSAPSKDVFRSRIARCSKYKGNREGRDDKQYYDQKFDDMKQIVQTISDRYMSMWYDDLEADDLVCMLQHPSLTFIYSYDKDLKQVPGMHYNMELHKLDYIGEEDAMKFLLGQTLTGDPTDNIPGIKGFGPKALEKFNASNAQSDANVYAHAVMQKYIEEYGLREGIDTFNEMWMLVAARIRRGDYFKSYYSKVETFYKTIENGDS